MGTEMGGDAALGLGYLWRVICGVEVRVDEAVGCNGVLVGMLRRVRGIEFKAILITRSRIFSRGERKRRSLHEMFPFGSYAQLRQ